MDTTKYTDLKTGTIVPIMTPRGQDHAFVPDPLPPTWHFPEHLWPKLTEARAAIAKLDGIGATLSDPELLLSPLKTREAITSSRIEGTYATAQELMLFEMNGRDSNSKREEINAWREVSNYGKALLLGAQQLEQFPFCGKVIKNLHRVLMERVRGQYAIPGEWRKVQVAIGSNWRFVPPPPSEVDNCIAEFEKYLNNEVLPLNYDPLVRAYMAHYQFEAIHPFTDGNGRIGRVILSLMIAKWCGLTRPWLYMSSFFEKYKDEYVTNMFKISTEGAWENWIDFCLTGTIHQAKDAIHRCNQLNELKTEMLARGHSGSIRAERIISGLFSSPFVRISYLRKKLGVSYPTAQADIDRLVKLNILAPLPELRPKCFYAPEIYHIAYAEQNA